MNDRVWRIAVLLFMLPGLAGADEPGPPQDGQETRERPPVGVVIEPSPEAAGGTGSEGVLRIVVTPRIATESLLLSIDLAGAVVGQGPAEWRQEAPSEPLIESIAPKSRFFVPLPGLVPGETPPHFDVPVAFPSSGYGYAVASIRSPAEGEKVFLSESFVLYFLVEPERTYFSQRSVLDLDVQKLKSMGTAEASNDELLRLRRRGAKVEVEEEAPPPDVGPGNLEPTPPPLPPAPAAGTVTVRGRVRFTDRTGATHPVSFVTVQLVDEGPIDRIVATTSTGEDGSYSFAVDNADAENDSTGRDLYVIVRAEGATVRMEDFNTSQVWAIDSLPERRDVPPGTGLIINLTATNNLAAPNNVAFEAYQAANVLSRYLVELGEPLPARVTIKYPGTGDGSSYFNSRITLAGTDAQDWDNIQHEYGHHIQFLRGNLGPGGPHSPGMNLCEEYGKDVGTRLAWGEAWPTYFAVMAQREKGLAALGIPGVGDSRYTDTKPAGPDFQYELETDDGSGVGEADELAVQRVLWDLFDAQDDAGDAGVSIPAAELWRLTRDATVTSLSSFHRALGQGRPERELASFGGIYARQGIGSEPVAPEDASMISGGVFPSFQWRGSPGCDQDGSSVFSVRFYDENFTSLLGASPWLPETSWTADSMVGFTLGGPSRWLIASRDTSSPETGIYYGSSRTIRPGLSEPGTSGGTDAGDPQEVSPQEEFLNALIEALWQAADLL